MGKSKIHKKLDELIDNPKSKKFLNHLIIAYLPVSKTTKVWEKPKGRFRCVLTDAPLISVSECLVGVHTEEFKDNFMNQMKAWGNDEEADGPIKKMLDGRVLAFTGEDTSTVMSHEAFQEFYNWIVTRMLKGDKHISWMLSRMQRNQFIKRAEGLVNDVESRSALTHIKNETQEGKRAMSSLGDLDVLKQLKAKMESTENK